MDAWLADKIVIFCLKKYTSYTLIYKMKVTCIPMACFLFCLFTLNALLFSS